MIDLTERHLNLPCFFASKHAPIGTDAHDELVSVGNLALVKAAARFDPEKGAQLDSWLYGRVEIAIAKESGAISTTKRMEMAR